jgi:TPP-dependent 2-oxoacid decarboxylase
VKGRRAYAPSSSPDEKTIASASTPLTHDNLFKSIDKFIDETWLVVADTSLGTYVAADLNVVGESAFMSSGIWASIGHSVAAGFGASLSTDRRPLIICGDGGFQMTAQALSTMARYGSHCVVVVVDNGLYAIEQYLVEPQFFSDPSQPALPYVKLHSWNYRDIAKAMGVTFSEVVRTPHGFESALRAVRSHRGPALIVASVDERDLPAELR